MPGRTEREEEVNGNNAVVVVVVGCPFKLFMYFCFLFFRKLFDWCAVLSVYDACERASK